ncbi:galactokinase [Ekhidna sp.]
MNEALITTLSNVYGEIFELSGNEFYVFSPGRINLLGEHIDYNDGIMLPAAIDLGIYFKVGRRTDKMVHLYSAEFKESVTLDLSVPVVKSESSWANYIIGVIAQFQKRDIQVPGFNLVFNGDLPIGAGLSSSAALECGLALIVNHLSQAGFSRIEMALMAQKAEHEYAGVYCGIMDQMASILGRGSMVIRLDSKTLDFEYLNLNLKDHGLVLLDSRVHHSLASSEYNQRREQCESILDLLESEFQIKSFRECSINHMDQIADQLGEVRYSRGKYVVEEIERVKAAEVAIKNGRINKFGELMNQTHMGLSNDYEVSCVELDFLFQSAIKNKEVIGCRMMGGGFGGCTLNLIELDMIDEIVERIASEFQKEYHIIPHIIPVKLSAGTTLINVNEHA